MEPTESEDSPSPPREEIKALWLWFDRAPRIIAVAVDIALVASLCGAPTPPT